MDTSYLYSLDDDFFDFGEPGLDYADSLDSPCGSTGSDIENQIIYDPNSLHPSPFHDICNNVTSYNHNHHLQNASFNNNNNNTISSLSGIVNAHGNGNSLHGKLPVKKVGQRKAANMRERRRMKSINDAFETLRTCIPDNVQAERRLSKVDTLRLAIRYIGYLADVLQSCNDYNGANGGVGGVGGAGSRGQRVQEKIIVRCHLAELDAMSMDGQTLLGHSLSWDDTKGRRPAPDSKLVAKVWTPENPTESDLINLAAYTNDY